MPGDAAAHCSMCAASASPMATRLRFAIRRCRSGRARSSACRRQRQRQVDARSCPARPRASARTHPGRRGPAVGNQPPVPAEGAPSGAPWQGNRPDRAESARLAQPAAHGRRPDRRRAAGPSAHQPGAVRREGRRPAARPRTERSGTTDPCLSARDLGRHGAARADRHGAWCRAAPADRRRADKRPRRHDPGAVPRRIVEDGTARRVRGAADHPGPRHHGELLRPCDRHAGWRDRRRRHDAPLLRRSAG